MHRINVGGESELPLFSPENLARLARDNGMAAAAAHADAAAPGWTERALHALRGYVRGRMPGERFTIDQARLVLDAAVDVPPDKRAWGAVTRRAIVAKLIVKTDEYAPASSSNLSPKPLYVKGPQA